MAVPGWFEVATLGVLGLVLLGDLLVVARRPREPSTREAATWVVVYVGLAVVFAGLLFVVSDGSTAGSFVAGWLTEYSLSVDNLFVFLLIMARFAVPRESQQTVLMIGIVLSLVLRGGCILLGAAAIEAFSWVFYLFGAFLIWTAWTLLRSSGPPDDEAFEENAVIRLARRVLPITGGYDGVRLVSRREGARALTPMVVVLVAIGSTDVLFALDSIPAIFGLTTDPFVVFTATLFALMGLRQLYFLLGDLLRRLVHLSAGLSVVLAFIGVKLVLDALHDNRLDVVNDGRPVGWAPEVPVWLSLAVIVSVLGVTALTSVLSVRRARTR